jgi:hypothetical protein
MAARMCAEFVWHAVASASARECVRARLGGRSGLMLCRQPGARSVTLVSQELECDGGAVHHRAHRRSHGMLPTHKRSSYIFSRVPRSTGLGWWVQVNFQAMTPKPD